MTDSAKRLIPTDRAEAVEVPEGRLYVNGRWRAAKDGATRPDYTPIDGSEIARIAQATAGDVNDAVAAAHAAFRDGPWPGMDVHERARLLSRIGDLIIEHGEELAYLETLDMGKPIAFSRSFDVPMMAQLFYYYGGLAPTIEGHTRGGRFPTSLPEKVPGLNYTVREPLGVVAAITPFNFPLLLSGTKIAPALAAGNTVVHKPASATPLSAIKIAEIMEEAGVPAGVFNLLTGPGGSIGDALVRHPDVKKVGFTGSTPVGKGIIKSAADTLKKTTMELGGKSANIVFADCDLDDAVARVFYGIYYNKGEICTAGSRLIVERSIHDQLLEKLAAFVDRIPKGNPLDPSTQFGPLASQDQYEKVAGYVDIGKEEGANLYLGGERLSTNGADGEGYYWKPTVFTGVTPEMRIFREEIFGPVLAVTPFDTEKEAIELANATEFGLASGVQTLDIKKAHRVAAAMQAGTVWVNTYNMYDTTTPFGGYKASGFGRECGPEVMENYTQTKSVWVDLS